MLFSLSLIIYYVLIELSSSQGNLDLNHGPSSADHSGSGYRHGDAYRVHLRGAGSSIF